jgi:hypothetical protein
MSDVEPLVEPDQVAEFDALASLKLGECYGALRGLAGSRADEAEPRPRSPEAPLREVGASCPACGGPLAPARVSPAELEAIMDLREGSCGHTSCALSVCQTRRYISPVGRS